MAVAINAYLIISICGHFILFDFIFYTATNVVYSILKLMFF